MRLKQYQKDSIVSRLVAVTFKDRVERKVAEENRLAAAVMNTQTTHEDRLHMKALPEKFFRRQSHVYAVAKREGASDLHARLEFEKGQKVPYFLIGGSVVLEDPALLAEIEHFVDSSKSLAAERDAFEKQTAGVVNSFSTSQKLIEAWPVVAEIMPAEYFAEPKKPQLPTTQINELDALVQGARPFETETIAA